LGKVPVKIAGEASLERSAGRMLTTS